LQADSKSGAKYILHEAAAAAASDPPALTLATATLQVECAFSISSPNPAAAAAAAQHSAVFKLKRQPHQQPEGLRQQLQVLGVDVITCAMHAKYPEAHQQQRYVFLLHRAGQKSAGESAVAQLKSQRRTDLYMHVTVLAHTLAFLGCRLN
jgi:hypothetical protein